MALQELHHRPTAPPSWASAGIVDARTFSVGESTTIHALTHYGPNMVRGACGITAHVMERDGRLAWWRADEADCLTCLERGQVALQVRRKVYRGQHGYSVTGRHGDSPYPVSIFVQREETARAIVAAYKARNDGEVSRLIREEIPGQQLPSLAGQHETPTIHHGGRGLAASWHTRPTYSPVGQLLNLGHATGMLATLQPWPRPRDHHPPTWPTLHPPRDRGADSPLTVPPIHETVPMVQVELRCAPLTWWLRRQPPEPFPLAPSPPSRTLPRQEVFTGIGRSVQLAPYSPYSPPSP